MKISIPDDWDGENWRCVQVQWPDSPLWIALLHGFLSTPARGRYWDERTGEIRSAQVIGHEIWQRNTPLIACSTPPPPPAGNGESGSQSTPDYPSGSGENEDDDMTSAITWLDIEDGKLYMYFGPCCRIEVGAVGNFTVGDALDQPTGEDAPEWSACGRATAVVNAIYAVADAIFDELDVALPWQWSGDIEDAAGIGDLKDKYLIEGVFAGSSYIALATVDPVGLPTEKTDIFADATKTEIICRLSAVFAASGAAMTSAERQAIDTIFKSNMSLQVSFFESAWRAIGDAKLSQIAQSGAYDTEAVCDCPAGAPPFGETTPDVDGWYLSGYYPEERLPGTLDYAGQMSWSSDHDVFGMVWTLTGYDVTGSLVRIKKMAAIRCEGDAAPIWNTDTTEGNTVNECWGIDDHFGGILGAGSYTYRSNSNVDFGSIEAPNFPGPITVGLCYQGAGDPAKGYCKVEGIRLLHNINSPSHA